MNNLQHERITVLAQDLRLTALADLYGGIAQSAANKKDTSYADFLEEVLKAERDARRVRSREMLTRTAGFPALKTLEAYDFAFATGAPRSQIQELASLGFVERAENIVLLGPTARFAGSRRVFSFPTTATVARSGRWVSTSMPPSASERRSINARCMPSSITGSRTCWRQSALSSRRRRKPMARWRTT